MGLSGHGWRASSEAKVLSNWWPSIRSPTAAAFDDDHDPNPIGPLTEGNLIMTVQRHASTGPAGERVAVSSREGGPLTTGAAAIASSVQDQSATMPGAHRIGRRVIAVLRICIGFVFLWAFLDKTFGLGFSTPTGRAWIHGGSPTKGFLGSVDVGPFESLAHTIAGAWWADWLFMLGLLGIGVAVIAGVALRASAVAGAVMLAMMWLAEFPLDTTASTGGPSGSTNPIVDYHIIYALVLIVLPLVAAGATWGLGRWWARLPYIRDHTWTR